MKPKRDPVSMRGKLVIAAMFALALVAAVFAWWYRWQRGARMLEYYGSEHAVRIRLATDVELFALQSRGEQANTERAIGPHGALLDYLAQGGISREPFSLGHLERRPGFVHARQALIDGASFDWDAFDEATMSATDPPWAWAIRFRDSAGETWLLFDESCHRLNRLGHPQVLRLKPDIGRGFATYLSSQKG